MALAHDFKKRSGLVKDKDNDEYDDGDGTTTTRIDKKQRQKEFMKNKKLKKKGRLFATTTITNIIDQSQIENNNDMQNSDTFITGEQAVAAAATTTTATLPSFLEQAEAPPVFNRLPHGAQTSSSKKKTKNKIKQSGMDDEAEQNAMEAMRRKVQAQYSLIKAQKEKRRIISFCGIYT